MHYNPSRSPGRLHVFEVWHEALHQGNFHPRQRSHEQERMNRMWQIPFNALVKMTNKVKAQHNFPHSFQNAIESMHSLQSGPSTTSTKVTLESRLETQHYAFYTYEKVLL